MRGSVTALHDADESDSDRPPEVSQPVEVESRPLDEQIWKAWQEKNRLQDKQRAIRRWRLLLLVVVPSCLLAGLLLWMLK